MIVGYDDDSDDDGGGGRSPPTAQQASTHISLLKLREYISLTPIAILYGLTVVGQSLEGSQGRLHAQNETKFGLSGRRQSPRGSVSAQPC